MHITRFKGPSNPQTTQTTFLFFAFVIAPLSASKFVLFLENRKAVLSRLKFLSRINPAAPRRRFREQQPATAREELACRPFFRPATKFRRRRAAWSYVVLILTFKLVLSDLIILFNLI